MTWCFFADQSVSFLQMMSNLSLESFHCSAFCNVTNILQRYFEKSLQAYRAGLRGGATGAIAPGPPLQGGPPWWNLFVSNEILGWKIFVIQKRYKNTTLLYSYVLSSMKGTQQQLITQKTALRNRKPQKTALVYSANSLSTEIIVHALGCSGNL